MESGVLESYLLGLSSRDEQEQVRQQIAGDQELSERLVDLEVRLKAYFTRNAVPPPPEIREILVLRNTETEITKPRHVFNRAKSEDTKSNNQYLDVEVNDTHIKVHKYWRPAFIAVFILSKIFLIAGLYYYFKSANLQEEIVRLKTEIRP